MAFTLSLSGPGTPDRVVAALKRGTGVRQNEGESKSDYARRALSVQLRQWDRDERRANAITSINEDDALIDP